MTKPIESAEELNSLSNVNAAQMPPAFTGADADDIAMNEGRISALIGQSSTLVTDAANALYQSELKEIERAADTSTPDDDRAAGRFADVSLDLLSE